MPRKPRMLSNSGYYHVTLRGAGKMILFEDQDDYLACLGLVRKYAQKTGVAVLAYCLMSNHIHLVVRDDSQQLSEFVRRFATSFALRYNERTSHVGHVFQNRFFSVPIESDESLLGAVRYVHQNPVKAKIASMEDYEWSSYHAYLSDPGFLDVSTVMGLFGSTESFVTFMHEANDSYTMPDLYRKKLTDDEAIKTMRETLSEEELDALSGDSRSKRDNALRKLKKADIGVAQACRLTGLGKGIVSRAYAAARR